jgi:hypothetical protein
MTYLATVNSGYTFDGWYDATGKLMSATPTVKFSYATALKDSQLTPKFTKQGTTPTTSGKLNDTGIVFGGNYPDGNNATCIGETIASQDCSTGRDATHKDDSDGHAGFSFTKLSKTGASLAATATDWACIKDNVTGLVWENKTTDGGIHDTNKRYRWGGVGAQIVDGKTFGERYADWDVLVNGSNSEKLCGFSDWRMPSRNELHSIVNYYTYNPAIDTAFFANTQSGFYWSSSPHASNSYDAWGVNFFNGYDYYSDRVYSNHARLVRGGQ